MNAPHLRKAHNNLIRKSEGLHDLTPQQKEIALSKLRKGLLALTKKDQTGEMRLKLSKLRLVFQSELLGVKLWCWFVIKGVVFLILWMAGL